MKKRFLILIIVALSACSQTLREPVLIPEENFSSEIDGKEVGLYTLKNSSGLVAQVTNYGGKIVNLWIPDKEGNFDDIVLGYNDINGYLNSGEIYFGALVGRYGNRIGKGKFTLNDTTYTLAVNNGENHLHGGIKGFNAVVWDVEQPDGQTLILKYLSPDMEEGYPGDLDVKVRYQLNDDNEFKIEYWATTDKATPVNLTSHSFFNLKGEGTGSINDHLVLINADSFTPVDAGLIPTGIIEPVEGTPMDFRELTAIGKRVGSDYGQLKLGNGYDHNFVLNKSSEGLNYAGKAVDPVSGRIMEVYTNEPGMQFYGGNFLDGTEIGKSGNPYNFRDAFCFETQHFPDSPNKENFPPTVLEPGEGYYSVCIYKFATVE